MAGDPNKFTYIKMITPEMKVVNIQFIVLSVGSPRVTKDGHEVRTVRVADMSGSVDLAVWNEIGEAVSAGDICRLKNGHTRCRHGCLSVSCGKSSEVIKIGEFMMVYSDVPNVSDFNPAYKGLDPPRDPRKRSPPEGDDEDPSKNPQDGPPSKQKRQNSVGGGSGNGGHSKAPYNGGQARNGGRQSSNISNLGNTEPNSGIRQKLKQMSRNATDEAKGTQAGYRKMEPSTSSVYTPPLSDAQKSIRDVPKAFGFSAEQSAVASLGAQMVHRPSRSGFNLPPPSFFQKYPPPPGVAGFSNLPQSFSRGSTGYAPLQNQFASGVGGMY